MKPILSIIVPAHNANATLPRLLESISAQNLPLEIIVVDDCSDEPCKRLALSFRGPKLDIRYIRPPQQVFTKEARLLGLETASAEIVTFADADDVLYGTDQIGAAVELFQRQEPDILHCGTVNMAATSTCEISWYGPVAAELSNWEIIERCAAHSRYSVWGKFYRRSLWQRLIPEARNFPVRRFLEDVYLSFLYALHAKRYIGAPILVYGYHIDPSKKYTRALDRMFAANIIRRDFIPYMHKCACPEDTVMAIEIHLRRLILKQVAFWLTDFSLLQELEKENVESFNFSRALTVGMSHRELLRILLESNALLASMLTSMIWKTSIG